MAFPTPSIGDILMLSQLAWKIGCAFTAGRQGAPAQFQEVENELKSLTTAVTLLAESLDEDGSLLARSDDKTREGLNKILGCCRQTLDDLDSFVNQYQEIKRPDEAGGLATQRTWRSVLLRNYKKIMWTTEGGGITSLRNMLAMHTSTISLTMQALQSRSLSRLEKIIEPVADQIDEMHNKLNGDLDIKIDEMHHVMLSLKASLDPNSPMIHPNQKQALPPLVFPAPAFPPPSSPVPASPAGSPALKPKRAPTYTTLPDVRERQTSNASWKFPQTPQKTPDLSDSEFSWQSPQSSTRTSAQPPFMDHRESSLIPLDFHLRLGEAPPEYEKTRRISNISEGALYSPKTLQGRRQHDYKRPSPPPASPNMYPTPPVSRSPKPFMPRKNGDYRRPSHEPTSPPLEPLPELTRVPMALMELPTRVDSEYRRKDSEYSRRDTEYSTKESDYGEALPEPAMLPPAAITPDSDMLYTTNRPGSKDHSTARMSQSTSHSSIICTEQEQEVFERKIFTDAIILCEVRGTVIDYTQPDLDKANEWKMVEACKGCRVCIVTKTQTRSNGTLRFMTSIWTLSDSRGTRIQQKIPDGESVIPYTVWGNTKKVVLRVETELKFHDTILELKPISVAKTSWVNFNFETEKAASAFQSALIGKLLILSVQTKRTMRIHDGIGGTFAFAEQLCGLENLRLFQDEQTGGVLAMIHYSPSFYDGYLVFYLNSTQNPLRIRDEDEKTIRVKGLNVSVDDPSSMVRRDSAPSKKSKPKNDHKNVKAVKIEFSTAEDKQLFKNMFKEIQSGPERFVT
ncbi:hypothetical protein MMC30_005340 [Trapelia coarctata]|nr:hypothetical protein [Trapelia coarctata]